MSIIPKHDTCIVKGVNVRTKHVKPNSAEPAGRHRSSSRCPFHVSNVSPCVGGKPSRVRFEVGADGSKSSQSRPVTVRNCTSFARATAKKGWHEDVRRTGRPVFQRGRKRPLSRSTGNGLPGDTITDCRRSSLMTIVAASLREEVCNLQNVNQPSRSLEQDHRQCRCGQGSREPEAQAGCSRHGHLDV